MDMNAYKTKNCVPNEPDASLIVVASKCGETKKNWTWSILPNCIFSTIVFILILGRLGFQGLPHRFRDPRRCYK